MDPLHSFKVINPMHTGPISSPSENAQAKDNKIPSAINSISGISSSSSLEIEAKSLNDLPNLEHALDEKEAFIEEHFEMLDESRRQEEIARKIIRVEKGIKAAVNIVSAMPDPAYKILEKILPAELLKKPIFSTQFKVQLKNVFNSCLKITQFLDIGANGLALIYRYKTVADAKDILASLQDRLTFLVEAQPKDQSENEEIIELRKIIIELSTNLKMEEQDLSFQAGDYKFELVSSFFRYVEYPVNLIFSSGSSVFIKTGIPIIQSTIGIANSLYNFYKDIVKRTTFTSWDKGFQSWVQKTQLIIDRSAIDNNIQKEIIDRSIKFLNNVPEINNESLVSPTKNNVALQPEIKAIGKEIFNKFLHEYQNKLQDISINENELERLGKHLDLPSYLMDFTNRPAITQLIAQMSPEETELLFDKFISSKKEGLLQIGLSTEKKVLNENAQFFEKSKQLLIKREAHYKYQINRIKPRINELMPVIKEIKKPIFDVLFKEYQEVLNIPDYPLEALNDLEKKLHLDGRPSTVNTQFKTTQSKEEMDILFENYLALETDDSLLGSYVDYQKTIEQTTKNALKELITKKNEVEENFSKFKFTQSAVTYGIAQVTAIVSISLAVIGLLTTPIAGAGLILIALSVPPILFSIGFMVASKYYNQLYRPQESSLTTYVMDIKKIFNVVKMAVIEYQQTAKEKKVIDTAEILANLINPESGIERDNEYEMKEELAIEAFEQAVEDRNKYRGKIDKWNAKLQHYQKKLEHARWNDFASYAIRDKKDAPSIPLENVEDLKNFTLRAAHLKTASPSKPLPAFGKLKALDSPDLELNQGTLQAFNTAFQITDLDLISPETKSLLEIFLGLDMKALQEDSKENSHAIKNALQKFFVINNDEYVTFIRNQIAYLEAKRENA
ncbi:MAG: hypothetical protein H0V82_08610 [Candidatus Protochlamydia sp.]|nr:hypothetical protein [Candidatus Protochlamydia sp.]